VSTASPCGAWKTRSPRDETGFPPGIRAQRKARQAVDDGGTCLGGALSALTDHASEKAHHLSMLEMRLSSPDAFNGIGAEHDVFS
jgi:hypothetical protein